ncbi:MAG: hypothetical protein AAFV59_13520 [Pseudomonadota bacterium]
MVKLRRFTLLAFMLVPMGACSVTATVDEMRTSIVNAWSVSDQIPEIASNTGSLVQIVLSVNRDLEATRTRYDLHHYYLSMGQCSDSPDREMRLRDDWETLAHFSVVKDGLYENSSAIAFYVTHQDVQRLRQREPRFKESVSSDYCLQVGAGAMWGISTFATNQLPLNHTTKDILISFFERPG